MTALLIIDMQKISFTPETPRFDTKGVVNKINSLTDQFRKKGESVIFIQHDGTKDGFCKPNTIEWEILDEINVDKNDIIVSKIANDSFYQSMLKQILQQEKIDKLVITGCATDFCVDSMIKSALTNEYKVTVIADAHTTGDRPHLKAEKVIEHYNWMWDEMIPINENKIKAFIFKRTNSVHTVLPHNRDIVWRQVGNRLGVYPVLSFFWIPRMIRIPRINTSQM